MSTEMNLPPSVDDFIDALERTPRIGVRAVNVLYNESCPVSDADLWKWPMLSWLFEPSGERRLRRAKNAGPHTVELVRSTLAQLGLRLGHVPDEQMFCQSCGQRIPRRCA